jgi:hypothetical protein
MFWAAIGAVLCAIICQIFFEATVALVGHAVLWPVYRARPGWDPSDGLVLGAGLAGTTFIAAGIWAVVWYLG